MTDGLSRTDPATLSAAIPGATVVPAGSLIGRFIVVGELGAGGMGIVLSAYDPDLDRKVAIKLLHPRLRADGGDVERLVARLLREAQAMARISHPNVIPVYEVGTFHEQVFIAMEFIDGGRLTDWLSEKRPWRAVVAAFLAAGRGLAAAHALGLVHRDFKPDNVLVRKDGRVLVTDFGVVGLAGASGPDGGVEDSPALAEPITREGAVVGTPGYMAPEQLAGGAVDARADQFAFCVALYRAFCGRRPFTAGSREPERIGSEMPRFLRPLVLRGLAWRPEDRHPSMGALLAAIERGPLVTRRRMLVAAALAAVLVGGAFLLARGGPASPRPALVHRRLTFEPPETMIQESAISPSGKLVAYVDGRGLHVLDLETGIRRDLPIPGSPDSIAWLPDSERFVLSRVDGEVKSLELVSLDAKMTGLGTQGDCPAVSHSGSRIAFIRDGDLWRMDISGQNALLVRKGAPGELLWAPSWSPDDRRIAVIQGGSILTVDVDGGDERTLVRDRPLRSFGLCGPLVWLADGRIFFATGTASGTQPGSELWTIREGSSDPESSEAFLDQSVTRMSASADGRRLAYNLDNTSVAAEVGDLAPGTGTLSEMRRLPGSDEGARPLGFSADGRRLLTIESRGEQRVLVRHALDGSPPMETVLQGESPGNPFEVKLHPRDDRVLFIERRRPGAPAATAPWRLVSVPVDAREPTRARELDVPENMRPWLACTQGPSATCVLWVFPDRSTWEELAGKGEQTFQRFDPDRGGEGEILRLPFDEKAVLSFPKLSPSGELFAMTEEGPSVQLKYLNGGAGPRIAFPGLTVQSVTFGADDETLFFTAMRDDDSRGDLYLLGRAKLDGSYEVLRSSKFEWMAHPTISPDGRRLALYVRSFDSDIWMIENP